MVSLAPSLNHPSWWNKIFLLDLRALLWGYSQDLPRLNHSSLLTRAALHIWYQKGLQNLSSSDPSPLTALFDNPALPQGLGLPTVGTLTRAMWPVAHSIVWCTIGQPVIPGGAGNWLIVLHLSTFCMGLFRSTQVHRPLTEYERLCTLSETPRHLLSAIY